MHVTYRIGAQRPAAHLFDVRLQIVKTQPGRLVLRLPAWIPGSYLVRDYARHVVAFEATDGDGAPLSVERPDKSSWAIAGNGGDVHVALSVYGWDLSVRGAHLDNHHAYFNGACVFPEVLGNSAPLDVVIESIDTLSAGVQVATSMPVVDCDARGFGAYRCADYDALIDHPVEIAVQQCVQFEAAGIPHRFFIRGADSFDQERLARDCAKICAEHHALLGTPDDLDAYTFLAYALEDGYGGLEHRWSTSLAISRRDLPVVGGRTDEAAYRKCLGLISHEYFHLWNVRRLKPAVFTPLDMTAEVHTGLLWVFEGITSYYDDLALARSGTITTDDYLTLIAQNLTRVLRTPGRKKQSLELSSFDAWTRFYKQDENAPNAIISYYAKGALAALALDLTLRTQSDTTLDAVMRAAWQRFYLDGEGMPERGLEVLACELSGLDLQPFFNTLIRGTDDIDIAALFAQVGIACHTRVSVNAQDIGGAVIEPSSTGSAARQLPTGYAGWRIDTRTGRTLAAVLDDSPAQHNGLSAGDELVAVNGRRADAKRAGEIVARSQPGDTLQITVFRFDEMHTLTLRVGAPPQDTVWLQADLNAGATEKARLAAWLAPLGA
ncbi:MAG: PDZ domain-containing protein [Pseudomonadota bacterium]